MRGAVAPLHTTNRLRVLLTATSENAAVDVVDAFQRAGFRISCECVSHPSAIAAAIDRKPWDVVICGGATGTAAARTRALVHRHHPTLPVVELDQRDPGDISRLVATTVRTLRADHPVVSAR